MLDTIVSIILFVLAFAILICIHEAGHLSMAKLFNVYCKEYSIGFGPAIFSKKKEGHETKFSIRAIPLGGYVSMYGEGLEDDPEFKDIPFERSLEGVKKWKKAIIISAGVILNAILAFVLIFISNFAFPRISSSREAIVTSETLTNQNIKSGDRITYYYPHTDKYEYDNKLSPFYYEFTDEQKVIHANSFFIVDSNVEIDDKHYVLTYLPSGNKKESVFTNGILLYKGIEKEKLSDELSFDIELKEDFIEWAKTEDSPMYYPDYEYGPVTFSKEFSFTANLVFQEKVNDEIVNKPASVEIPVHFNDKGKGSNTYDSIGLSFKRVKEWLPAKERFRNTFVDYGEASAAVFKGLKVLFTGGIRNMSGIVGIFDTSASLYSNYAFSTYLFFWGLISVNLAIFNLLPFPGLDGWQLLVTAIEGISRKKLPPKFKTIMSLIGLALLFALMIAIVVLDILRIVGV